MKKFSQKEALIGQPTKNPRTFREQVILELWEQKTGKRDPNIKHYTSSRMNAELIGKLPDHHKIIELMEAKKKKLIDLKENIGKKQERINEQI